MKTKHGLLAAALLLSVTACNVVDSGPTQVASDHIDAGAAEAVRADISMGAGQLHIEGGSPKLLSATFRFSENVGRPLVRYDVTGAKGHLTVESPKSSTSGGRTVNDWDVQLGSEVPLDINVSLGAGESNLDMAQLPLRSLEVNMGAGEMSLNVAGKYKQDVTVHVNGGVGEAKIHVPKDMGAVIEATGGIGGISTNGLTKRDGKYYNDAYTEGKPAVHMDVQGGVGSIVLSVGGAE